MPTVKGCPKCISIHSGGLLGLGAAKCKGCGGELADVRYEIPFLVWAGLAIFIIAALLGFNMIFMDVSDFTPGDFEIYWSVEMAMEIFGLLLFIIGSRTAKKQILARLAEVNPEK